MCQRTKQIHTFPNKRKRLMILLLVGLVFCTGCKQNTREQTVEEENKQQICEESKKVAEGYREIYESAAEQNTLDTLGVQRKIIDALGNLGCVAVDRDDQINMINYEQAVDFCENAKEKKPDKVTIYSVIDNGGFVRYDMESVRGEIQVTVSTLRWEKFEPEICYYHKFTANSWKYSETGYFFIEEYQPPGYDGAPGQIAFRIKPLSDKLREMNRKYVMPVGYEGNNLLISNWNEKDYSNVDFYDLYEHFYYQKYGRIVPYQRGEGAEYKVPAEKLEEVILPHFLITSEQIRENAVYDRASNSYRYRPRGMNDANLPYGPYPEVVNYKEEEDGTICLSVEGVWERKMTDRAVTSELIVRPLKDGSFQYVSNRVTGWNENLESSWYTPRLTEEEWKYHYTES